MTKLGVHFYPNTTLQQTLGRFSQITYAHPPWVRNPISETNRLKGNIRTREESDTIPILSFCKDLISIVANLRNFSQLIAFYHEPFELRGEKPTEEKSVGKRLHHKNLTS